MPKTLLAVDDSATMRKVLEITFSGEDFRVATAHSRDTALAKLNEEPSVVVIDSVLDSEDGYALAREIRQRDPHVTLLLLASRYHPYDANRGRDAGVDDYMDKPFDTQQMIDKVKKAIVAREAKGGEARPAAQLSGAASGAAPVPPQQPPTTTPLSSSTVPHFSGAAPVPPPQPIAARPPAPPPAPVATGGSTMRDPFGAPAAAAAPPGPAKLPSRSQTISFEGNAPPPPFTPPARPHVGGAAGPVPPVPPAPPAPTAHQPPSPQPPPVAFSASKTLPTGAPVAHPPPHAPPPPKPPEPHVAQPATHARSTTQEQVSVGAAVNGQLAGKLSELGLTPAQADAVLALSREVVERVVWEVVPQLAETIIKEEIARLTKEGS